MNLEESNAFVEAERKKQAQKKIVIASMAICAILIAVLIVLIGTIQVEDALTFKLFINDVQDETASSKIYTEIDDVLYVNLKEIGQKIGYQYKQGVYKQIEKDESSCYFTNNFEIITFTAEEESFGKYTQKTTEEMKVGEIPVKVKSEPGQLQKYNLTGKIKLIDGVLYAPFEALPDMFNAQVDLENKNNIKVYTFDEVVRRYSGIIGKTGYSSMSGDYENLKAMLYGMAVVGDNGKFGVISLKSGEEIISTQCEDITFIPNLKHFLIEGNNEVGIISSDGTPIIKTNEYDEIAVYDEEHSLYIVKKDGKYGIVDKLGKIIIYTDYDEIGYKFEEIKNRPEQYNVIFGKCIPVRDGRHYGLFSIDGRELLPCVHDEFGSALSQNDNKENDDQTPIFLIPEEIGLQGIIVNQNGLYGLYDVTEENMFIPIACTKAYSITKAGTTTYYVEHAGIQYDLKEYIGANKANSEDKIEELPEEVPENEVLENEVNENEVVENTVVEENTNTTVETYTPDEEEYENVTENSSEENSSEENTSEENDTEENLNETIENWRDVVL